MLLSHSTMYQISLHLILLNSVLHSTYFCVKIFVKVLCLHVKTSTELQVVIATSDPEGIQSLQL